jgi:Ner family transcriptional regulator
MSETIPEDNDKRWQWIKYQLSRRGLTLSRVAAKLNVHLPTLCQVKYHPIPRYQKALADLLKRKPQLIWPERYNRT